MPQADWVNYSRQMEEEIRECFEKEDRNSLGTEHKMFTLREEKRNIGT